MVKQKKADCAWDCDSMHHGKRYFGACEGAKSRRHAEAFERTVREKATQIAGLKSVKALYESFREDLAGGRIISLDDAFGLALKKPRKRTSAEKRMTVRQLSRAIEFCSRNETLTLRSGISVFKNQWMIDK